MLADFNPRALSLLHRPNPVLSTSPELAWLMVLASTLVVGPAEEYIFRGFVYGGLLSLLGVRHWLGFAFVSSVLFAVAHVYYALVYGVASLVPFSDLVIFGMAMASVHYLSGGNLLIPALIHGVYDATWFLGVATSPGVGAALRLAMIGVGLGVAVVFFVRRVGSWCAGSIEARAGGSP